MEAQPCRTDGSISPRLFTTINNYLSKCSNFNTKYALMIGTNQIYSIIECVRNIILDWSITLEENGILGDELRFSDTE